MQHAVADGLAAEMQDRCLGLRVGRLARLVQRAFDQELRPLGLTVSQLEILGMLTICDAPVAPSQAAEWLAVERSTMSRNLALLERNGWVQVAQTSATGRSMAFSLTPAGTDVLAAADAAWRTAQASVESLLGPESVRTLDGWLQGFGTA